MYYSIYHLVGACDALITDYSSVFIDYLLLDRPICFAFDDVEEYKNSREFAFDNFEDYMCGQIIHDVTGLISFLDNINKQNDSFKGSRKKVLQSFHTFPDNKASERTYNLVFNK